VLPSILASELRDATRRFLITAYEPSDPFFHGIVRRFVEGPEGVGKGPYLQLGLPFRMGTAGRRFFPGFETDHAAFAHQERAWQRLASDREARSTLVATGTGSGKTECFAYPILDHCARARAAGQSQGIKALVIYPMNALATDQARRFAEWVAREPAFRGLRVGMYVGSTGKKPGSGTVMTATEVITDRETLRKAPPDILLTNYKMLDYLLVRPKDRALWAHNQPGTLRYLVVDELHTFDGAQGTDLALLLRRLRRRLGTPDGHLVHVGTSATLGDGDTAALREYARQVFGVPFDDDAVVTEQRDTVAQFLGDQPIAHVLVGRPDLPKQLEPSVYRTPEAAIAQWFDLFFPGEPKPDDPSDPAWRAQLGALLKQHLLFNNLLRVLKGSVQAWPTITSALVGPMPEIARACADRVLDALVALIAWARAPDDPGRPLVTVRVQIWLRELRRLVANVEPAGGDCRLRSAADLRGKGEPLHLPLVQCAECHTTGWVARRPEQATRIDPDLDIIYNAWFRSAPEIARLYPRAGLETPATAHRAVQLCGRCGTVNAGSGACPGCGNAATVPAWEVRDLRQTESSAGVVNNWHLKQCPACGSRDRLLLLGARNATLGAQLIEQGWASLFNADRKLIAFSDSVQDAAHRAGFFGSRTWLNNIRMAMTQVIGDIARPAVPWASFLKQLPERFLDEPSPRHMSREAFVSEFIASDMTWQRDWEEELRGKGRLPDDGRLVDRVAKRLAWQGFAEFTYLSRRGRTLDRMGVATLVPDGARVQSTVPGIARELSDRLGLRHVDELTTRHWVWGLLLRLKQRGAVTHPELEYLFQDGNPYQFRQQRGRDLWLPQMGQRAAHPVALSLGSHRDAERLVQADRPSWYQQWMVATLGSAGPLPQRAETDIHAVAFDALEAAGLLRRIEGPFGAAIVLADVVMSLETDVAFLMSAAGHRALTLPESIARELQGMPCLDAMQVRYAAINPVPEVAGAIASRFRHGVIRRVITAEHTGLLEAEARLAIEERFKAKPEASKPWYENLLSATPTLEMGVDIGSLSSVLLCSIPPNQASYLQRIGRAGRRDGNALVMVLADGASPHDLYFYAEPMEMLAGPVDPPGVFLQAAEVLRRQLLASCIDAWVASGIPDTALPDKTSVALDAIDSHDQTRFPYNLLAFIQRDEDALFEAFLGLLGEQRTPAIERRLRTCITGDEQFDGLRVALLKALQELAKDRSGHRKRAEALKRRIAELKAKPQDEATRDEIDQSTREREKCLELSSEIGRRDLLGTLTDAGLLPNYAFPESGIELKSVIWRRRQEGEDGQGKYVTYPAVRYERPAASALSEFAPENRFYANQHRVEVDQINLQLSQPEPWRLCPRCHHVENLLASQDGHAACPRCGDPMWSNVAQKRMLLRFRQAMANAEDRKSRIDDSAEDREPKFFLRQLLADFEPADIEIAWKLDAESIAFGFEFIRKAVFRDINFGEAGRPGETFPVADREASRPGFRLCARCGMVQKPARARGDSEQNHARDCQYFGRDGDAELVDCLYLYREFASEALRILVPYTRRGLDETVLQSFMAALQMGLKRRFGGRVDHLRFTTQEEPGIEGAPRRHYVLVYDAVPGGTGYLHQLLSEDASTLGDVLRIALEALEGCGCRHDTEKDGCYRCVYQYRLGRAMEKVSRRTAAQVLGELVASLGAMQRVKSISEIAINPNFDSELESRFVTCLQRLGGAQPSAGGKPLPLVRVVQEVVDGSSGFLLEVDSRRYWMKPQASIGPEQGVRVPCKADFLIWPAGTTAGQRPIAVFTDGWAYHRDRLRLDASQRSALVASGRYWVWSVTWDDVSAALDADCRSDMDLAAGHAHHGGDAPLVAQVSAKLGVRAEEPQHNAVAGLIRWLAHPTAPPDSAIVATQCAAMPWLGRLTPAPNQPDAIKTRECLDSWAAWAVEGAADVGKDAANAASANLDGPLVVAYRWPRAFLSRTFSEGFGAVLLDTSRATSPEDLKLAWRRWLGWFNRLQTLPGMLMAVPEGVQHGDYAGLRTQANLEPATQPPPGTEWTSIIDRTLSELRPGLERLAAADLPAPDNVGEEIMGPSGEVLAEVEMLWHGQRVVVLAAHQSECAEQVKALGWRVTAATGDDWWMDVRDWIGGIAP
jgi:DEAD/DEAH box helicase domain-containing protein